MGGWEDGRMEGWDGCAVGVHGRREGGRVGGEELQDGKPLGWVDGERVRRE